MAENLNINHHASKKSKYEQLLPQLKALVGNETDTIANMANISAALKHTFNFFWVGFYQVKHNELVLGPFQGTVACTRIAFGRGVCGTAWKEKRIVIVPDVNVFPGHIACDAGSQSEIVVPVFFHGQTVAVLDVDSDQINFFDETDAIFLQQIANLIAPKN